jgi:hypothetical protein
LYIDSDKKTLTSSDSEKANVLADFFSSVFTEEDDLVMPELDINPDIPNISAETIKKKLDNLKIDKSPGPDNIHPRILRELSNILSEPLSIFIATHLLTVFVQMNDDVLMLLHCSRKEITNMLVITDQLV